MSKLKLRESIYNKYGGRCSYCGCELNGKFQVDHLIPKSCFSSHIKNNNLIPNHLKHLTEFDCEHFDNLMPSCQSCNNYKTSNTLEGFRFEISQLVRRLNSTFTQYRIAKRFDLIKETEKNVIFYFENYI